MTRLERIRNRSRFLIYSDKSGCTYADGDINYLLDMVAYLAEECAFLTDRKVREADFLAKADKAVTNG